MKNVLRMQTAMYQDIFFFYIPIKSYNICYKLHYTTYRDTLQYKLHDTTYKNDSTILLQRCPEEQKTMSTPRPLNIYTYKGLKTQDKRIT